MSPTTPGSTGRVALKLPRPRSPHRPIGSRSFSGKPEPRPRSIIPTSCTSTRWRKPTALIFMTMELVQGRSLRELLSAERPLPLPRTLAFASQIAEGLACAHAAGILHRDLKPANVMITDDDRVKILDFGVAKFFRPRSIWDPEASHDGARTCRPPARRSARSATCLRSRRSERRSTRAPTSSRWASCFSRWQPGSCRSTVIRRRRCSISCSTGGRPRLKAEPGAAGAAGGSHRQGARERPGAALSDQRMTCCEDLRARSDARRLASRPTVRVSA